MLDGDSQTCRPVATSTGGISPLRFPATHPAARTMRQGPGPAAGVGCSPTLVVWSCAVSGASPPKLSLLVCKTRTWASPPKLGCWSRVCLGIWATRSGARLPKPLGSPCQLPAPGCLLHPTPIKGILQGTPTPAAACPHSSPVTCVDPRSARQPSCLLGQDVSQLRLDPETRGDCLERQLGPALSVPASPDASRPHPSLPLGMDLWGEDSGSWPRHSAQDTQSRCRTALC